MSHRDFNFGPPISFASFFVNSLNEEETDVSGREVWPRQDHEGLPCDCYTDSRDCTTCDSSYDTTHNPISSSTTRSFAYMSGSQNSIASNWHNSQFSNAHSSSVSEVDEIELDQELSQLLRQEDCYSNSSIITGNSGQNNISRIDLNDFVFETVETLKKKGHDNEESAFLEFHMLNELKNSRKFHQREVENQFNLLELRLLGEKSLISNSLSENTALLTQILQVEAKVNHLRNLLSDCDAFLSSIRKSQENMTAVQEFKIYLKRKLATFVKKEKEKECAPPETAGRKIEELQQQIDEIFQRVQTERESSPTALQGPSSLSEDSTMSSTSTGVTGPRKYLNDEELSVSTCRSFEVLQDSTRCREVKFNSSSQFL
ncbi:unnamed protein product [Caenorhabditis auriculariae]|uniref:Uncharacterized protein n=1 Tax=Caenorhabditis auriculariae TaxID=2777116 RepID=A0A8S1HRB4_9PELO|nr:unnamed protein product [Caenorhabditis auriculariae]